MTRERQSEAELFTQVEISAGATSSPPVAHTTGGDPHTRVLNQILQAMDRNNELLEELLGQMNSAQKQRQQELGQWRQSNPRLAQKCRAAAETLSRVQTEFLDSLVTEVRENGDALVDGEFMLTEFVDRFGPRLAHLNGVLQVLSQLSAPTTTADS